MSASMSPSLIALTMFAGTRLTRKSTPVAPAGAAAGADEALECGRIAEPEARGHAEEQAGDETHQHPEGKPAAHARSVRRARSRALPDLLHRDRPESLERRLGRRRVRDHEDAEVPYA